MALTKAQREVWRQLEPDGWEQRGYDGSGGLVLAHPRVNGYLSLHGTPSDYRHTKNTLAQAKRLMRQADTQAGLFLDWLRERYDVPIDGRRRVDFYLHSEVEEFLKTHKGTPASIQVALTKVRPWLYAVKKGGAHSKSVYEIAGPQADLPVTLREPVAAVADAAPDAEETAVLEPSTPEVPRSRTGKRALPPGRRDETNGNGAAPTLRIVNGTGSSDGAEALPPPDGADALELPGVPMMPADEARAAWEGIAGTLAAALHPHIAAERDVAVEALRRAERALSEGLAEARAALDMLTGEQ